MLAPKTATTRFQRGDRWPLEINIGVSAYAFRNETQLDIIIGVQKPELSLSDQRRFIGGLTKAYVLKSNPIAWILINADRLLYAAPLPINPEVAGSADAIRELIATRPERRLVLVAAAASIVRAARVLEVTSAWWDHLDECLGACRAGLTAAAFKAAVLRDNRRSIEEMIERADHPASAEYV